MNNKNELLSVLKNLPKSKDSVILLDGKWGSGKTHLLNEFIKEFNECPIYYVSLLGKRNVDDINTALYMEVNKDRVIENVIPSSVSPFNDTPALDYALKIKEGCNYIVIMDDLERYASTNYDEFLSYVLSLVLRGVKIVVVSNLTTLGVGEKYNFDMYKEKIFDHIYKTKLFSNNVLEVKLGKYYKDFDEYLISILNDNIRIVDKVAEFLGIIENTLSNKFPRGKEVKTLYYYSIVLITTLFNNIPLSYPSLKLRGNEHDRHHVFNHFDEESDSREVLKIHDFSMNLKSPYTLNNSLDLIIGLYELYLYGKSDYLLNLFK